MFSRLSFTKRACQRLKYTFNRIYIYTNKLNKKTLATMLDFNEPL